MSPEDQKSSAAKILVCLKCFTLLQSIIIINMIMTWNCKPCMLAYTSPPITWTKSGVRTNGAHSLLIPCNNDKNCKLAITNT